jgi:hypothetical protein
MANNDSSIHKHIIFLAEKRDRTEMLRWIVSCPKLNSKSMATKYHTDRQVGRCQRMRVWYVSSQFYMLH